MISATNFLRSGGLARFTVIFMRFLCLTFKMSHGRSGPLALAPGSALSSSRSRFGKPSISNCAFLRVWRRHDNDLLEGDNDWVFFPILRERNEKRISQYFSLRR